MKNKNMKLFNLESTKCRHSNLQFVPLDFNGSGFFACSECETSWTPFCDKSEQLPLDEIIKV